MTDQTTQTSKYGVLFWVVAFFLFWVVAFFAAMAAAVFVSVRLGLSGPWSAALTLTAMLVMIPMVRAAQRAAKSRGAMTPAVTRYNRRFTAMSFGYVAMLLLCVGLFKRYEVAGPALWMLALLPTLPTMGMIWAMARLLAEEEDEYQRQKMVSSALIATGFALVICTLWGFLETFGLVPNIWLWAVFPIWAIGLGLGQFFVRDKL